MDVITMSSVVQHGLIFRDRIFTVSVLLPDKPGELSRVAAVIAEENGNVIKLEHNQFVSINRSAAVELRITLEAFGTDHKKSDSGRFGERRLSAETGQNEYLSAILQKMDNGGSFPKEAGRG